MVLPWGALGVQLFFVLSGFLITGILLGLRDGTDGSPGRLHRLRQFYVRRSLRILPIAYFVVVITAILNVQAMRETLPWNLTYTTNVYFALRGAWNGPATHLWSLAVEEQFYLLWPWLMLLLPDRYLLPTIVGSIVIASFTLLVGSIVQLNPVALTVLTPACMDRFGVGALLAWLRYKRPIQFHELARKRAYRWSVVATLPAVVATIVLTRYHGVVEPISSLCTATFFGWIIHRAAVGFSGVWGRLLEARVLVYCGKISYGIYLYHNFMHTLVPFLLRPLRIPYPHAPLLEFMTCLGATLLAAACSWTFFERPINEFRQRFEYWNAAPARMSINATD